MKKVISLLLVMCCFVSAFSFSAFAKYDGDILFRDIPWGSTYEEVMKALEELDVNWREPVELNYRTINNIMIDNSNDDSNYNSIIRVSGNPNSKTLKVGGFEVESIRLFFAKEAENGQVVDDLDHTYFYLAEYTLTKTDPSNEDNDINLLNTKLRGIYGSIDKKDYTFTYSCDLYYYYGNNNTEVVPVNEYHALFGSLNELRLYYACTKGDDIAKNTNGILFNLAAQSDTEGL